jgi:N-formylglutamate deformylase
MSEKIVSLQQRSGPIIISMPHTGEAIPANIASTMTDEAALIEDTDWKMHWLYDFAETLNISIIQPHYSRYVIDLNRDPGGESLYPGADTTELCPSTTFKKQAIYKDGRQVSKEEEARRVEEYWQPYHQAISDEIARVSSLHNNVLLFEAHSIASVVPRFFEGHLPDFNWGTNSGSTASQLITERVESIDYGPYTKISNGRFKGGFITRNYANPQQGVNTLQLELSQATYMNETSLQYDHQKAALVKVVLKNILTELTKCLE